MKVSEFNFSSLAVPKEYIDIWNDACLSAQVKKAARHGIGKKRGEKIFKTLSKRGFFLTTIAKYFNCKNIAEVGTASGYQFFSFCEYASKNNGFVYSCDIIDVRSKKYINKYSHSSFTKGNSSAMLKKIINDQIRIDLFYIDGDHGKGSVSRDISVLKPIQSKKPVWIFDDYNKRFGCYKDIKRIHDKNLNNSFVYSTGLTASGKPNTQLIIVGRL